MSPLKKTPTKKTAKKAPEKVPARKAAAPRKEAAAPAPRKEAAAPAPRKKAAAKPELPPAPPPPPSRDSRRERPRKRKPSGASSAPHMPSGAPSSQPGLGNKWTCFKCQTKFYDLNKPVPLCPKCGSDQRQAPKVAPTPPPAEPPRPRAPVPAMPASLLEEDEATVEDFEADGAEFDIGPLDEESEPEGDDDFLGTEEPVEEEAGDEE